MIRAVAEGGFKMVMSNLDSTYLDCGLGSSVTRKCVTPKLSLFLQIGYDGSNWCQNFRSWEQVYENNPGRLLEINGVGDWESAARNIAGGEAAILTKHTDYRSIMPKTQPRTAAYAEALWRST